MKNFNATSRLVGVSAALVVCISLSGCASTYGNLVSGSNLGAQEYQPAVLVKPGMENNYSQILGVCRNAAVNKQITSAQKAQLHTITGVTEGALSGAASGMQVGAMFKSAGFGTSINRSAGLGLATGVLTSLGSAFSSGTKSAAEDTRHVLLHCLRVADPGNVAYTVLE